MGVVIGGYGVSSVIMTQLQLAICNPNNVEANSTDDSDDVYFTDPEVLDNVPTMLYAMSGLYLAGMLIGNIS